MRSPLHRRAGRTLRLAKLIELENWKRADELKRLRFQNRIWRRLVNALAPVKPRTPQSAIRN